MGTATLTIPSETKEELKRFSWINWSEVAEEELIKQDKTRRAFEKFKELVSKSKLSEEDAEKLSDKIKLSMHKQLKDAGLV